MISVKYRLVKWLKNGSYRKLSITIQEDSVFDFCEMMNWSEHEFANNTIRYPIFGETEIIETPEQAREMKKKFKKAEKEVKINESKRGRAIYPAEILDYIKDNLNLSYEDLAAKVGMRFKIGIDSRQMYDYLKARGLNKKKTIYSNDERLKPKNKSKQAKYPDEMELFVENHMNGNTNQELCDLINKNFNVEINMIRLPAYMAYKNLKRDKKKVGKPKKWTDEIIQFLRDNRDKYSKEDFCVEVKNRFNIEVTNSALDTVLVQNKIKKDYTTGFDKDIFDFVLNSKITDVILLRDEIIEKFSKNMATGELRKMISERTEKSKIESVHQEVKRVSNSDFDGDVDEMDLNR